MDRSAVKEIVEDNFRRLRWETQTQDWTLEFVYGKCSESEWKGEIVRELPYRKAVITIDPDKHESVGDVLNTVRHELCHVMLAPFDLYMHSARRALADDASALRMLDGVWVNAVETVVGNLERMFDQTGRPNPFEPIPLDTPKKAGK